MRPSMLYLTPAFFGFLIGRFAFSARCFGVGIPPRGYASSRVSTAEASLLSVLIRLTAPLPAGERPPLAPVPLMRSTKSCDLSRLSLSSCFRPSSRSTERAASWLLSRDSRRCESFCFFSCFVSC